MFAEPPPFCGCLSTLLDMVCRLIKDLWPRSLPEGALETPGFERSFGFWVSSEGLPAV